MVLGGDSVKKLVLLASKTRQRVLSRRGILPKVGVHYARPEDISSVKRIADCHRHALSFLPTAVFNEAMHRRQLLVAETDTGCVLGFVRFNHRQRGTDTALYDICVDQQTQRQGIGRALVQALVAECAMNTRTSIVLRCPQDLPANGFYEHLGFDRIGVEAGKRRDLVVWRLRVRDGV